MHTFWFTVREHRSLSFVPDDLCPEVAFGVGEETGGVVFLGGQPATSSPGCFAQFVQTCGIPPHISQNSCNECLQLNEKQILIINLLCFNVPLNDFSVLVAVGTYIFTIVIIKMLVSFVLLFIQCCARCFPCIITFNPQDNQKRGTIIVPILQKVKQTMES